MTQIKEFLRRGLFTVIVLCSAAACSNNDENEDTNYTLDGIQWACVIVYIIYFHYLLFICISIYIHVSIMMIHFFFNL